jgi:hypothetical protein
MVISQWWILANTAVAGNICQRLKIVILECYVRVLAYIADIKS